MKDYKGIIIYPPAQLMRLEAPRPDGSLGPLYLAASLEKSGISTDILDASVGTSVDGLGETFFRNVLQENGLTKIGMSFEEIGQLVEERNYDFVGLSSNFTPQTRMVFGTAEAIKRASPKTRIYVGGVNARALYERFLKTGLFDAVCLSEGENIFPRIAKARTVEELKNVPGIALVYNGEVIANPVDNSCFPVTLDDIPMPLWRKLPFEIYDKINSTHGTDVTARNGRYAPIMTSRGCVFNCLYCHISCEKKDNLGGNTGQLRLHSLERVIQEVETLKSLGVKKLFFEDDSLFARKERAREIFSRLGKYDMSIANVNGVNIADFFQRSSSDGLLIDESFIALLKQAGFAQVVFPVESGSQRILNKYATGKVKLDRMNIVDLMNTLNRYGIKAPVNLMIGFPDETEEEIMRTVEIGRRLKDAGAPYVSFFIPIPFPGSQLYNYAVSAGHLDPNFDTDIMNWKRPVMKNTLVKPERLVEIRDRANEEINDSSFREQAFKKTIAHRWSSGK